MKFGVGVSYKKGGENQGFLKTSSVTATRHVSE
jgi:hypothetical protein